MREGVLWISAIEENTPHELRGISFWHIQQSLSRLGFDPNSPPIHEAFNMPLTVRMRRVGWLDFGHASSLMLFAGMGRLMKTVIPLWPVAIYGEVRQRN